MALVGLLFYQLSTSTSEAKCVVAIKLAAFLIVSNATLWFLAKPTLSCNCSDLIVILYYISMMAIVIILLSVYLCGSIDLIKKWEALKIWVSKATDWVAHVFEPINYYVREWMTVAKPEKWLAEREMIEMVSFFPPLHFTVI